MLTLVEKVARGILSGGTFIVKFVFDIFQTAVKLLRWPLYIVAAFWLLAAIIGFSLQALRGAATPFCYLPGVNAWAICRSAEHRLPQWADFPRLTEVQSITFDSLLDEFAGGPSLSLEIKKAQMATADLVVLVRRSNLKSRETLADILGEFIADAKTTGRDLQRLNSKIGGAVDW
jgi:hypothetical protein